MHDVGNLDVMNKSYVSRAIKIADLKKHINIASTMKRAFYILLFQFLSLTLIAQVWEHLTPVKSNDRLKSTFLLNDSTAYMGGWFGRLYKTKNKGKSWSQVEDVTGYPISGGIWGMHFPTNTVGFIADDAGRIYKTEDASASWLQIYNNVGSNFYDSYFFNADSGFVCGEFGEILKTIDGGDNWESISSGVTSRLYDFCFTNDSVGYLVGRNGKILKTIDTGNNWTSLESGIISELIHIEFFNEDTGICVGLNGMILRTTDGGENWESIASGTSDRLSAITFLNELTVLVVGDYGMILRSDDAGESFTELTSMTPYNLWALLYFPNGACYALGDRVVLESYDLGLTWDFRFDGVPESQLMRMQFTDSSTIHAVGREAFYGNTRSAIIKSSDKGRVWHTTYEGIGSSSDVTDVSFINEEEGFASAYNTIRSTTDGGETSWNFLNEPGYFTAIHFFDADTGLVGNTLDGIFLTTDGGNNWDQVESCPDVNHFFFLDRDTGYAATDGGGIRKTTDGGATWLGLNVTVGYNLQSVFFVNDSTGFAVGDWSNGIKTTDYGASWSSISTNQYGRDVHCPDPSNPDSIYVLTASGEVQKSIDGGDSWTIAVPSMNNQIMWDFEFSGSFIYACGDHGDVLRSRILPCTEMNSTIDTLVCDSYTAPDGQILTQSGQYNISLPNGEECFDHITLNLIVNVSSSISISETACDFYIAPDGQLYYESGIYHAIIPSQSGCDSIISIDLSIISIDVSISDYSPTLIANAGNAEYQWLDCSLNYEVIEGENDQSFTAIANGSYAVEITQNNCVDSSLCITVLNSTVGNSINKMSALVYPNPSGGRVEILFDKFYQDPLIEVKNISGQTVLKQNFASGNKINFEILNSGFYIIEIKSSDGELVFFKIQIL